MRWWVIASGEGGRRYADDFIDGGFMAIGPGEGGAFSEKTAVYQNLKGTSPNNFTSLRAFKMEAKEEDIVLLREGTRIRAIGRICSSYAHSQAYGDIKGWDLQHCRAVSWLDLNEARSEPTPAETDDGANDPPPRPGTFYTFCAAGERLQETYGPHTDRIPPDRPSLIDDNTSPLEPSTFAEDVATWTKELRPITKFWTTLRDDTNSAEEGPAMPNFPSEDEVSHYAAWPFLRAMGWRWERVAVNKTQKRGRPDMTLYKTTARDESNVFGVVELKTLHSGLDWASSAQIKRYLDDASTTVYGIVTDGVRWSVYRRSEANPILLGYVNLLRLPTEEAHWWIGKDHREKGQAYKLARGAVDLLRASKSAG